MKLSRKLVPAIAMLLVSAVMLSTASFAWFSMNTQVTATGMQVQAQAMGSLIISPSAPTQETVSTTFAFATNSKKMIDATHVTAESGVTSAVNLMTIADANRDDVKGEDGTYTGSFTAVTESADSNYYQDYVCYIAANSKAVAGTLTLTLDAQTASYFKGIAADIYVATKTGAAAETALTFQETLWLDSTGEANKCDIAGVTSILPAPGTPGAETTGYVKILMRVYIDGAKTTEVQNAKWTNASTTFTATFNVG